MGIVFNNNKQNLLQQKQMQPQVKQEQMVSSSAATPKQTAAVQAKQSTSAMVNQALNSFSTGKLSTANLVTTLKTAGTKLTMNKNSLLATNVAGKKLELISNKFVIMNGNSAIWSAKDIPELIDRPWTQDKFSLQELKEQYKFSDTLIEKYFTKIEGDAELGTEDTYLLDVKKYTLQMIQQEAAQEYQTSLIIDNFLNNKNRETDSVDGIKSTSDNTQITADNYAKYADEIGIASAEEAEALKKEAVEKLIKDFSSGNLAFSQVKTILDAIGIQYKAEPKSHNVYTETPKLGGESFQEAAMKSETVIDMYTVSFTFNGKTYEINCNPDAAAKGSDNIQTVTYSAESLEDIPQRMADDLIDKYLTANITENGTVKQYMLKSGVSQSEFEKILKSYVELSSSTNNEINSTLSSKLGMSEDDLENTTTVYLLNTFMSNLDYDSLAEFKADFVKFINSCSAEDLKTDLFATLDKYLDDCETQPPTLVQLWGTMSLIDSQKQMYEKMSEILNKDDGAFIIDVMDKALSALSDTNIFNETTFTTILAFLLTNSLEAEDIEVDDIVIEGMASCLYQSLLVSLGESYNVITVDKNDPEAVKRWEDFQNLTWKSFYEDNTAYEESFYNENNEIVKVQEPQRISYAPRKNTNNEENRYNEVGYEATKWLNRVTMYLGDGISTFDTVTNFKYVSAKVKCVGNGLTVINMAGTTVNNYFAVQIGEMSEGKALVKTGAALGVTVLESYLPVIGAADFAGTALVGLAGGLGLIDQNTANEIQDNGGIVTTGVFKAIDLAEDGIKIVGDYFEQMEKQMEKIHNACVEGAFKQEQAEAHRRNQTATLSKAISLELKLLKDRLGDNYKNLIKDDGTFDKKVWDSYSNAQRDEVMRKLNEVRNSDQVIGFKYYVDGKEGHGLYYKGTYYTSLEALQKEHPEVAGISTTEGNHITGEGTAKYTVTERDLTLCPEIICKGVDKTKNHTITYDDGTTLVVNKDDQTLKSYDKDGNLIAEYDWYEHNNWTLYDQDGAAIKYDAETDMTTFYDTEGNIIQIVDEKTGNIYDKDGTKLVGTADPSRYYQGATIRDEKGNIMGEIPGGVYSGCDSNNDGKPNYWIQDNGNHVIYDLNSYVTGIDENNQVSLDVDRLIRDWQSQGKNMQTFVNDGNGNFIEVDPAKYNNTNDFNLDFGPDVFGDDENWWTNVYWGPEHEERRGGEVQPYYDLLPYAISNADGYQESKEREELAEQERDYIERQVILISLVYPELKDLISENPAIEKHLAYTPGLVPLLLEYPDLVSVITHYNPPTLNEVLIRNSGVVPLVLKYPNLAYALSLYQQIGAIIVANPELAPILAEYPRAAGAIVNDPSLIQKVLADPQEAARLAAQS